MDKKNSLPNIVLILTDDQGWGDLSYTGNLDVSTPNIDKLADDGAKFDWFYVQPLCAPTRAEILTGRYFPRTGVRGVTRRAERINLDETTMGDIFKNAGYATGCFGKWHSGAAYPYHPNGRGFDEFYGFCCGHWSHYFDYTLEHNGEEVKGKEYIIDDLTTKAIEFIEDNKDEPFLCYVPFNSPHSPFQVPDRWFDKFKDKDVNLNHRNKDKENVDVTRSALAMCENIDWNVGRITNKITQLGLTDNTIIIYLSDNGPNSWRWNNNMSGSKGSTDEGGVRSPFSITWKGEIESKTRIETIAGSIDILPTLADLVGIDIINTKPLDGISLKPALLGDGNTIDRELYSSNPRGDLISIRTQQYRADKKGLYDITKDLEQYIDLSKQMPQLYNELNNKIDDWKNDVFPNEIKDRPIPVGYQVFPNTYLTAQDGTPTGKITWSSIHPNASYFINWENINDSISWDIEVETAGEYEAELMYTCVKGDEGSEISVEFNGEKLSKVIDAAFDSPLKDKSDRVKRAESYDKEFKSMYIGKMHLDETCDKLILRAISKKGKEVCEVKGIKLRLL